MRLIHSIAINFRKDCQNQFLWHNMEQGLKKELQIAERYIDK